MLTYTFFYITKLSMQANYTYLTFAKYGIIVHPNYCQYLILMKCIQLPHRVVNVGLISVISLWSETVYIVTSFIEQNLLHVYRWCTHQALTSGIAKVLFLLLNEGVELCKGRNEKSCNLWKLKNYVVSQYEYNWCSWLMFYS